MLAAQRKDLILATLRTEGRVVAKELAAELELSEDTIRRDLRELAAEGRLHRVHGGALPASPAVADFTVAPAVRQDAKAEVGRLAAGLVRPGQTVIVDGGYDGLAAGPPPPADLDATVVTHSPTIAVRAGQPPVGRGHHRRRPALQALGRRVRRGRHRGDRAGQRRRCSSSA